MFLKDQSEKLIRFTAIVSDWIYEENVIYIFIFKYRATPVKSSKYNLSLLNKGNF